MFPLPWQPHQQPITSCDDRVSVTMSRGWQAEATKRARLRPISSPARLHSSLCVIHDVIYRVSTTPGNLEFVWSSWKFLSQSTALVSNHNETGYRIAYLRNWWPLSLPWPNVLHIMFLLYI